MEGHAYLGEVAAAIFYLVAGVRLLRLAGRTGEVPERLLGLLFLFSSASYVVYEIPIVFPLDSLWEAFNFAGRLLYLPAAPILAVFTRRVFRPESAWAAWLVGGCAALLVAGVVGSALTGDWEGFALDRPWFWLDWSGYTIPFAWAAVESLAQYRQARRRTEVGLCDPLVCNRLLLWGLFGTTAVLVSLVIPFQYAAYARESVFNATFDGIVGVGELLTIGLIWIVFFPPAPYRRWIAASATRTDGAGGN
jgi:hypothetical protein